MSLPASTQDTSDEVLILAFANSAYREVLHNWLAALARLGIRNFRVIACDRPLASDLEAQGVPVDFRPCSTEPGDFWVHRVRVLEDYLEQGVDIIHSDLDAVGDP